MWESVAPAAFLKWGQVLDVAKAQVVVDDVQQTNRDGVFVQQSPRFHIEANVLDDSFVHRVDLAGLHSFLEIGHSLQLTKRHCLHDKNKSKVHANCTELKKKKKKKRRRKSSAKKYTNQIGFTVKQGERLQTKSVGVSNSIAVGTQFSAKVCILG